jgi:hypothetical protein
MDRPIAALGMSALAASDIGSRARQREWEELLRRPAAELLPDEPGSPRSRFSLDRLARLVGRRPQNELDSSAG